MPNKITPPKPQPRQVEPEDVKRGMNFEHLGILWEVISVRPDGISNYFRARAWMVPAGYSDCELKLDVNLSNQFKWLEPQKESMTPSQMGKKSAAAMTPAERSARAKKASTAARKKYGVDRMKKVRAGKTFKKN